MSITIAMTLLAWEALITYLKVAGNIAGNIARNVAGNIAGKFKRKRVALTAKRYFFTLFYALIQLFFSFLPFLHIREKKTG